MSLNSDYKSGKDELDISQDIPSGSKECTVKTVQSLEPTHACCSEPTLDSTCMPQESDAETTNIIENTNSVSEFSPKEGTLEESENSRRKFGLGKDGPNSEMELESRETHKSEGDFEKVSSLCLMEVAVDTGSKESLVVSVLAPCGKPSSDPCQDTTSNDENILIQSPETNTVRTDEKVHTADSEMDVDLEHNAACEKVEALHGEVADVSESVIIFDSNLSNLSTMESLEPIVSVQNVNSLSDHRGAVVPYSDTEDSDSSSSTSSCVDSSDESSESESSSSDSENETGITTPVKKSNSSAMKTKDKCEQGIEDLPPIQDLHISVRNDEVVDIGRVLHTVDTLVVVEGLKDLPPLDIDSVLFLDRGARPLGRVFDVMGPVTEPLYCVRFNSKEHIEEHNIQSGMLVYCAPKTEHSNFVFLQHLLRMKGSDASWKMDSEVPLECLDFSDDEEEAKLKKMHKTKKADQSRNSDGPKPKASRIGTQSSHLPSSNPQSGRQNVGRNDGFRPRNPWNWSGARTQDLRNQNGTQSHRQEASHSRGSVRPSSFTTDVSNLQSPRNYESGPFRYPQASQFGQVSDPRMFGQPPSTHVSNSNTGWCSTAQQPHTQPNNAYAAINSGSYPSFQHEGYQYPSMNYNPSPEMHCSGANGEDQRYHAFQSEIARLVDAYNRGAEAPPTAPSVHFNGRQAVRPQFPTLPPPPGGERASTGPPSFHANRLPIPSRLPPPSHRPPAPHHLPSQRTPGPNFSYQNYYSGQW